MLTREDYFNQIPNTKPKSGINFTIADYKRRYINRLSNYKVNMEKLHQGLIDKVDIINVKKFIEFTFNPETGDFKYGDFKGILSPKKREFHFLKTLYISPTHQSTYQELLNKSEPTTKTDKIDLTEVVRVVKNKLGILPKSKKHNRDIIKNIANYGYKLEI